MRTSYLLVFVLLTIIFDLASARRVKPREDRKQSKTPEVNSMICPSCDRLFCTVKKASKLDCKGGVTTDICDCCPVCAKQVGDPCGGEWNYLGKCDRGLECRPSTLSLSPLSLYPQHETTMGSTPEGTCVKWMQADGNTDGAGGSSRAVPRSGLSSTACRPKCSPEFCLLNPKEICSAVDVVDMKRDCHGMCQHTSCQACSWVDPDPDCGACSPDDFGCIKKFAKCIKKSYCTRAKFPCKRGIAENQHVGKFQCMVPKCLDKS